MYIKPASSFADLKNTSDDAIPNYLNSLKFTQSHRLADVRLALGYAAFAVAGLCFLWDYKLGFEATKWYTAAAVAVYTLLNGALTAWILYVERGTVYVGTAPSGETLRIASATTKNVPEYNLTVEVEEGKGGSKAKQTVVIKRPFTEWFDAAGHFVAPPFQSMLATSVPVIGKRDPKRAVPSEGVAPTYTPEMLDALASASVSAVESAAETASGTDAASAKKGSKRRKA